MSLASLARLFVAVFAFLRLNEAQIMSVDIGHEFFKVALMRQGAPLEVVLNAHSKRKTPTAVSFFEAVRAVGDDALGHSGKAPKKVPLFFHSLLGLNFTSAADVAPGGAWWKEFALSEKFYTYDLGYDEERGVPTFQLNPGNETQGEEALANIIHFAKVMAEDSAEGKKVQSLILTVPADATLRQRQALIAAGTIANINDVSLVHEGSAFAVQRAVDYQPEKGESEIGLFYNLGSRKAEATVVKFDSRQAGMVAGKTAPVITVLGAARDAGVGGHFFDVTIAEKMLKQFQEKFPKLADGIAKNPRALRKLLSQAQKTKAILSANKNAPFIVESLYEDTDFISSLSRKDFEGMCADMFSKLTVPIEKALAIANVSAADIKTFELIGGAWRVPKVQELLAAYFEEKKGTKVQLGQHLNGEEGGAMGAALVAANHSSSFRVKKIFFTDITMHEYSVQVASLNGAWEKNVTSLYPFGAPLGGKKKLAFSLEEDFVIRLFEDGVLVSVYEATGLVDALSEKWSGYNLTGPPKISVSVVLDTSGVIDINKPVATVEESYFVNVTQPVKKANKTANKTDENATEPPPAEEAATKEEEGEAKADENATTSDGNSTANATNATDPIEYEVVLKPKKKKHEKKLTVKKINFKPVPLDQEGIEAARQKLKDVAEKEGNAAAVAEMKNELEAMVYSSRDKVERDDYVKVTTEAQREEVMKLCTEIEEWMYEDSGSKEDYSTRLGKIRDAVGPIDERVSEMEARESLGETVEAAIDEGEKTKAFILKNMTWVNVTKVEEAAAALDEFKEWWAKRQEKQRSLPLSEAPAFTKAEVETAAEKAVKKLNSLKKTKKPKEPKKKDNATKAKSKPKDKDSDKATEEKLPTDAAATEKELEAVRAKKAEAVEKEDFDLAHSLKAREKQLVEHLATFTKSEL